MGMVAPPSSIAPVTPPGPPHTGQHRESPADPTGFSRIPHPTGMLPPLTFRSGGLERGGGGTAPASGAAAASPALPSITP